MYTYANTTNQINVELVGPVRLKNSFFISFCLTIMGTIFGSQKPLKEVVRENQRMLKKAVRELEKEIANMKKSEVYIYIF